MKLYIVGFGAGSHGGMTFDAENAILNSDIIVGYTKYVQIIKRYYPEKEYFSTGMRQESERVEKAFELAENCNVSLICSGDSSVYGLAGLAFEISQKYPESQTEIEVIAGVTSALSGGAVLGSPMGHDFAVISLSDLLTPWEKIEKRIEYASMGDFVIAIYNPSSEKRPDYLAKACEIMMKYKSSETVCGYVRNIGREGQCYSITTLGKLKNVKVDMFTTVFIGNSETKIINNKMVTPRGYKNV